MVTLNLKTFLAFKPGRFFFPGEGNHEKGATLIEVLTVLALIGILSAMLMPKTGFNKEFFLLQASARSMAIHMRLAQSHAIATNSSSRLVYYQQENIYYVELSGEKEWVYLPEGISIVAINFPLVYNRHTLRFNYYGVPNQGGHVLLRNHGGDRQYIIITPVTGRVRTATTAPG